MSGRAAHAGTGRELWLAIAAFLVALAMPARAQQDVPEAGPLAVSRPPDAENGRRIVTDRRKGLCLLCHSGPFPEVRFQGDLAPSLAGAGSRWTPAQLRARLIDSRLFNGETIMPPYFRAEGQSRMAVAFKGRTILTAEEIEDVTAFLATLRE
ncbi:sulfur oxidation c-type cytochrome SoxX [Rhabdaerophilum sp. SD176]|uniref:sulfur oxidation c-type cytochrome SoxX n=1 Tax=Rhabdaerophilum sp. SD176 TaxID=2983548 RepID=UPI0024DFE8D1|nr:sulfur oxidation c-type cytochrome SoxX [Rhabdaerophilum sp. SD176]